MQKEKLYSAEEINKLCKDDYKNLLINLLFKISSENPKDW